MPLTQKGSEIESNMKKEYGPSKGEQVFYASKNAGKITGVDTAGRVDTNVIRNFDETISKYNGR